MLYLINIAKTVRHKDQFLTSDFFDATIWPVIGPSWSKQTFVSLLWSSSYGIFRHGPERKTLNRRFFCRWMCLCKRTDGTIFTLKYMLTPPGTKLPIIQKCPLFFEIGPQIVHSKLELVKIKTYILFWFWANCTLQSTQQLWTARILALSEN